jgi:hypothetical protein
MKAHINSQLHHDDPTKRWQQFSRIEGQEDKTEKSTTQSLPNGRMLVTDRSHPAWEFQFVDGGKGNHIAKMSYNGYEEYYVIFPYSKVSNVLEGCESEDDADVMTGYTLGLHYTHDVEPATRTTVAAYKTLVQLADAAEMNEKSYQVKCNCSCAKLLGVREGLLSDITPGGAAAGVFDIALTEGDGDTNLVTQLGTSLIAAGNFTCINNTTGNAITFAVAANPLGTGIRFTLSTVDADYDDAGGVFARISGAAVSVLAAAGCKYFEFKDADGNLYILVEMN